MTSTSTWNFTVISTHAVLPNYTNSQSRTKVIYLRWETPQTRRLLPIIPNQFFSLSPTSSIELFPIVPNCSLIHRLASSSWGQRIAPETSYHRNTILSAFARRHVRRRIVLCKAPAKRSQHANATCRNIVGQNMLRAFGHRVATCWVLLAQIWPFSNLSQQHPTCRNTSQHGGQTHATSCAQQCCDMLRWHVAIVWPGLNTLKKGRAFRNIGKYFPLGNSPKKARALIG